MTVRAQCSGTGPQLRGRQRELELIGERVDALAGGHGSVLLVEGASGAGKTSLLSAAGELAAAAALRVHHGAGDPAAEMTPLGTLLDALTSGLEPLIDRAALRDLAAASYTGFWVLQEVQERLERAAAAAPILIAVDDLQWADGATLLVLRMLPRRLAGHPILWLLALRPAGAEVTATRLREIGAEALALQPLDEHETAQLAGDALGGEPDAAVLDMLRAVGGQPALLCELLRGLREERLVRVEDGRALLLRRRLPKRFRKTVADRLERLSAPAREATRMASVLGSSFSADRLAMLLECSSRELLRPLEEALQSELLAERDDRLAFRHELVRETVLAGLPASVLLSLRRRAAELMADKGAPAADVAALLLDVAEPGDAMAIGALRRAAGELGATPDLAVTVSRRALELTPQGDPERPAIVAETVPRLFRAGLPGEARALGDSALEGALEPVAEATVRLKLAQVAVQHSFSEAVTHSCQALELPELPAPLRLELRLTRTLGYLMTGEFEEAHSSALDDLAAARAATSLAAEAAALNSCSAVAYHRHHYRQALEYADEARARAAAGGAEAGQLWPDVWAAWLRGALGQVAEALPRSHDGLQAARREGRTADARFWLACRSTVLLTAGRLAEARAEAEAVLKMAGDPALGGLGHTSDYVLGRVALHTGDAAAMSVAAEAATAMRADGTLLLRRMGDWLAALLADAEGDHDAAAGLLEGTVAALGRLEPTLNTPQDPLEILRLMRVLLRAGDRSGAAVVAGEIERRAKLNRQFALHRLLATHARGLQERDPGAMRASVETLDLLPGPVARAEILEDAAGVLVACDRAAAAGQLDRALALYAALGAEHDAARVRRSLRDLGVRRRRLEPERPASGWGGLTGAELAVVRLVAAGATNRQAAAALFLSPHTVSSHLRHAFGKLGIRSRVELALLYAEHQAEPAR